MKVMSWNCQGLGNPLTIQELRALTAQERPNLLFIMETKNKAMMVERIRRKLKFQKLYLVDPTGIAGGLAIMWQEEIDLKVQASSKQFIDVQCIDPDSKQGMQITFVHASTDFGDRLALWQVLGTLKPPPSQPWICMGDFNEILYVWEKVGKKKQIIDESQLSET